MTNYPGDRADIQSVVPQGNKELAESGAVSNLQAYASSQASLDAAARLLKSAVYDLKFTGEDEIMIRLNRLIASVENTHLGLKNKSEEARITIERSMIGGA